MGEEPAVAVGEITSAAVRLMSKLVVVIPAKIAAEGVVTVFRARCDLPPAA
ncbi:hypothetical protein ACSDR0_36905 [Streptosporangium sp. G11]|uniref:hypothetical protein n=1 Tax=Streptosporangium sp. G11 TaxID=3436926 RepID=UPI003EBA81B1